MKKLIILSSMILFGFTSIADERENNEVLLAIDCAQSLYVSIFGGPPAVGESCRVLFQKNQNRSVLSILHQARNDHQIPEGISFIQLQNAIEKIEATGIIGSGIYLKEDGIASPPKW